jgi:hypothetical protein
MFCASWLPTLTRTLTPRHIPEMSGRDRDDDENVGEPVCWLNRVCDVCGALVDASADACWRCDTPVASA